MAYVSNAEYKNRIDLFSKLNRVASVFHNANRKLKPMSPIDLNDEDVFRFLKSLERLNVKYLLVGGFAMAFHGYVRATHDLDLWVKDDAENIQQLKKALTENGVEGLDQMRSFEMIPGFTQFHVGDSGFVVEPLKSLKVLNSFDFASCYERAESGEYNGLHFKVIHAKDLLKEKEGSNRPKDQGDIEHLRSMDIG
jgi:hypothetical protein